VTRSAAVFGRTRDRARPPTGSPWERDERSRPLAARPCAWDWRRSTFWRPSLALWRRPPGGCPKDAAAPTRHRWATCLRSVAKWNRVGEMAGRKPKPTVLKLITGNPGRRPLNRREPKLRPGIPSCPPHLSPEAKREWSRVIPLLAECRLVTEVDRAALAAYCQA
jgi:hypothetical protein